MRQLTPFAVVVISTCSFYNRVPRISFATFERADSSSYCPPPTVSPRLSSCAYVPGAAPRSGCVVPCERRARLDSAPTQRPTHRIPLSSVPLSLGSHTLRPHSSRCLRLCLPVATSPRGAVTVTWRATRRGAREKTGACPRGPRPQRREKFTTGTRM